MRRAIANLDLVLSVRESLVSLIDDLPLKGHLIDRREVSGRTAPKFEAVVQSHGHGTTTPPSWMTVVSG